MPASDNLKRPKWDTSIADFIAFRKYMAQVESFAVALKDPNTPDRQGLKWALYSPAKFQVLTGAPLQRLVNPGLFDDDMVGGALESHKRVTNNFDHQETNIPVLANVFEGGLPDRIRKIIE